MAAKMEQNSHYCALNLKVLDILTLVKFKSLCTSLPSLVLSYLNTLLTQHLTLVNISLPFPALPFHVDQCSIVIPEGSSQLVGAAVTLLLIADFQTYSCVTVYFWCGHKEKWIYSIAEGNYQC